jgi:5-oxoprolinase (ATP-hydrolysing)
MLLSGPAGGAIGAANFARRLGFGQIITLDMGGTSTDVARIAERPGYRFTQEVAGMKLLAPSIHIETVASGGGSICRMTHQGLAVGPESAGSNPGPACYGKGGPLTITDVNLLLGRFDANKAPIPLDLKAAQQRLIELHAQTDGSLSEEQLLLALLRLAIEHMTDAIRRISIGEGYDPADHVLLAFGGAGPQHACAIAENLGIRTILVPKHAGILSAVGLQEAIAERIDEKEYRMPLEDFLSHAADSSDTSNNITRIAELRLYGQDLPLQVEYQNAHDLPQLYIQSYLRLFGYPPPDNRTIELVSLPKRQPLVPCLTQARSPLPLHSSKTHFPRSLSLPVGVSITFLITATCFGVTQPPQVLPPSIMIFYASASTPSLQTWAHCSAERQFRPTSASASTSRVHCLIR